jgi:H+/gluconate symporter-like permease
MLAHVNLLLMNLSMQRGPHMITFMNKATKKQEEKTNKTTNYKKIDDDDNNNNNSHDLSLTSIIVLSQLSIVRLWSHYLLPTCFYLLHQLHHDTLSSTTTTQYDFDVCIIVITIIIIIIIIITY